MLILLFILIIALLAIWIGYQLTHAPKMSEEQEREDFTFTVRIPLGTFQEGEEITPWSVLERIQLEEEEEQE